MKKLLLLKSLLFLCALLVGSSAWADPITLFHETFGDNSGSARAWDTSYSVKSGVSTVYSSASYSVTSAKQSKNTMGQTKSALVSSQGGTGVFVVGPLNVSSYETLAVTNYFGMSSASWQSGSFMKMSYSTNGSTYTEVSRTDSNTPSGSVGSNSGYVQASYSLPAAAQSSTLYLKFEFYCYNLNKYSVEIGQAYFDEVELQGVAAAGADPSITLNKASFSHTKDAVDDGSITVTYNNIASVDAEVLFYESDGTTTATYDWIDADINNTTKNVDYIVSANTVSRRTAYMKVHQKTEDVYSDLITITQASGIDQPTFDPVEGAVVKGTTVSLLQASATSIRYTTDGTEPTKTTGSVYSTPIVINAATTIKAIAIKGEDVSDVATAAYTLKCATPTFSLAQVVYETSQSLELSSSDGAKIYYTMKTDGTYPNNPTSSSTEYKAPISITSSTIIKAIAIKSGMANSEIALGTFRIVVPTNLPFNWAGGSSASLKALQGVETSILSSDYANSHNPYLIKFDDDGKYIQVRTNGPIGKVTIGVKMIGGANESKIIVKESADGTIFTDVEELTISGKQNDILSLETSNIFDTSSRWVRFEFNKGSGSNVGVGPISIAIPVPADPTTSGEETYLTTSDNMAGWRAFYDASYSYSVDGNTKVYVADADPVGTTITLKAIDGIPANVPVILHTSSSADSYKMTLTKKTVSPYSYTGDNNLIWTSSAVSEKYRLGFGASGVGFYPYSGTPASGAVILNVSSGAGARELTIGFEDEATGVADVRGKMAVGRNDIYNLNGQKVLNPTKGLYIVNGKKVIIK